MLTDTKNPFEKSTKNLMELFLVPTQHLPTFIFLSTTIECEISGSSNKKKTKWSISRLSGRRECLRAISNEIVAGIEISFKEKDTKYLEFLFVYYMNDLICEDHDWEFF
ncbi:hypothetical protein G4B88_020234 [Cannabis sativa]|uniref:Ycf2 N-terminal domain-containing protein n=1 Tax=Cannabis sativa TaxID=3483 RepID=A0A7J6GTZ2_CANSA|nr:hypothetical protein G4B88_020234 [Cannabis sativa]